MFTSLTNKRTKNFTKTFTIMQKQKKKTKVAEGMGTLFFLHTANNLQREEASRSVLAEYRIWGKITESSFDWGDACSADNFTCKDVGS